MSGRFEPKTAVQLNPPKDDPISKEELARANGTTSPAMIRSRSFLTRVNQELRVKSAMWPSKYVFPCPQSSRLPHKMLIPPSRPTGQSLRCDWQQGLRPRSLIQR